MPTEINEALIAYTGNPPPPNFSLDGVLAAGRRRRRRHRLGAGGALLAVALGVCLTVPSFVPRPMPYAAPPVLDASRFCAAASAPPPPGPLVTPTWVTDEKNGYRIRIPTEPAAHASDRLSCYLAEAVPPLLRGGVTLARDASAPAGVVPLQAYPARVFDPSDPAGTVPPAISASAYVTEEHGTGTIGFGMSSAVESAADAARYCGIGPGCRVRSGPHGETVTVLDSTSSSGVRVVNVRVYRGDTDAFASASNAVMPAPPGQAVLPGDYSPGYRGLPLTVDQLITLACAPVFDLFPS